MTSSSDVLHFSATILATEELGARTEFEPYELPDPSLEGRVDLRDLTTFTIDPETAKDFDDALSIREENGGFRAASIRSRGRRPGLESEAVAQTGAAGRREARTRKPGLTGPSSGVLDFPRIGRCGIAGWPQGGWRSGLTLGSQTGNQRR